MPRKQHDIHYIYKTTCNITGRYYIGMHSTSNLDDGYLGSGLRLTRSVRKYGKDNHMREILEFFDTREDLIEAEKKVISSDMLIDINCMNLKEGGSGGFINKAHQQKACFSGGKAYAKKFREDTNFSEKFIREQRIIFTKIRNSEGFPESKRFTGKQHTELTKEKISGIKRGTGLGENNSQYGTCWITKDCVNKKIKKEDLNELLNNGWQLGRFIK